MNTLFNFQMRKNPGKLAFQFVLVFFIGVISYQCAVFGFRYYLGEESREIHENFWTGRSFFYGSLMDGTTFQTPVFHFKSEHEGPAVLILGGTHGNEPAGFEAAHRLLKQFASMTLKKGEIFIIPEANKIADLRRKRRIPVPGGMDIELGNLNRCYPGDSTGLPMQKMAFQITELMKKHHVDILLDLHESPVFHLEMQNEDSQYHGLGQTIIYTPNEQGTWLAMIAIDEINTGIPPGLKQFSLAERPVLHSAAWNAGETFGIPGFTLETCKQLDLEERVQYHIDIVNIMLRESGIL